MTDSIQTFGLLQKARVFANYGYLPEPKWDALDLFADDDFLALRKEVAHASDADLHIRLSRTARAAFEDAMGGLRSDIVVPLSGGRDSRFILAMAAELGFERRVVTFSFGTPGGLDYEIAKKVAAQFGVRHERLNILREQIQFADLRRAYESGAHWTDLMVAHFCQSWRRVASPDACALIGYLGGEAAGSHCHAGDDGADFAAASRAFDAINRVPYPVAAQRPMFGDISNKLLSADRLSPAEQLDLVFRQEGYIRRLVASPATNVRTPLAHPDWLRLMYALPSERRIGCRAYVDFLQTRFPRAFATPTTNSHGALDRANVLEKRLRRFVQRGWARLFNSFGAYGRASLWKYGDPRQLSMILQPPDENDARARAYGCRLNRRAAGASLEAAKKWRLRTMLACNFMFSGGRVGREAARLEEAA